MDNIPKWSDTLKKSSGKNSRIFSVSDQIEAFYTKELK